MSIEEAVKQQLSETVKGTDFEKLGEKYQGKVRGKDVVVPITTIGIREDGEGYGGAHKFEMLVAEDFGKNVESVSRDIFGDQEPIVFPDSAATLRSKEN